MRDWLGLLADPATTLALASAYASATREPWATTTVPTVRHILVGVERGAFVAEIGGRRHQLLAGNLLWVPPGVRRRFAREAGPALVREVRIHVDIVRAGRQATAPHLPLLLEDADDLVGDLQRLFALHHRPPGPFQAERVRGELLALAAASAERGAAIRDDRGRTLDRAQRERLSRFAVDTGGIGVGAADLARALRLSPAYCARLVKATVGCSPTAWLLRERMRTAARLIGEEGRAIAEVARLVCGGDLRLLYRQFRAIHGCTPAAWRDRHAGAPPAERDRPRR